MGCPAYVRCQENMPDMCLNHILPTFLGDLWKNSRPETVSFYGEWRAGRTRNEKRAAKRAKYLGIPLQGGEHEVPELFFYGVKSGVVGLKVADVAQACTEFEDASHSGYDKVCFPYAIQSCYIMCLCSP